MTNSEMTTAKSFLCHCLKPRPAPPPSSQFHLWQCTLHLSSAFVVGNRRTIILIMISLTMNVVAEKRDSDDNVPKDRRSGSFFLKDFLHNNPTQSRDIIELKIPGCSSFLLSQLHFMQKREQWFQMRFRGFKCGGLCSMREKNFDQRTTTVNNKCSSLASMSNSSN